ncbi:hypothetical protein JTE90_009503 [Oedothorax gibbosus]|uniref:RRM domain-containing protein n=1 Tax=Oedothorax gibbosus TaxID=931172 RepID=A0AAV6UVB6_9ARAC|nr:hypothetical protein JTE90_009503 [Oedothorax gibbosus]
MDEKEQTLYCGNLSEKVTEDLLYELFLQAGPLESVSIPKDKDGRQKNFGFVKFKHSVSVQYAVALMDGVALFGRILRLDVRSGSANAFNPFLEKLREYQRMSQRTHRSSQRDSGRQDSRRHDSRNDSRQDIGSRGGPSASYGGFSQQYMMPQSMQNLPQGYPMNYGGYPASNQWSQFR